MKVCSSQPLAGLVGDAIVHTWYRFSPGVHVLVRVGRGVHASGRTVSLVIFRSSFLSVFAEPLPPCWCNKRFSRSSFFLILAEVCPASRRVLVPCPFFLPSTPVCSDAAHSLVQISPAPVGTLHVAGDEQGEATVYVVYLVPHPLPIAESFLIRTTLARG